MADEMQQMKLRLPEDLKLKIAASAERNKRSLNSEVIKRLQDSLNTSDKLSSALIINMYMEILLQRIDQIRKDHPTWGAENYTKQRIQLSKLLKRIESELEAEIGELPIPRHRQHITIEDFCKMNR